MKEQVFKELEKMGIEYEVVNHPPAFTTQEADAYIEGKEGVRSKTMFMSDKKRRNFYLLILDDLGTEAMNNAKFSELFNILNTRLLKDKKILISTNLTPQDIKREYEERIFSRFVGDFIICRFVGEDIRLLKKKLAK